MSNPKDIKKPAKKTTKKINTKSKIMIILALISILLVTNLVILSLLPSRSKAIIQTRSEILAQQLQNQSANKIISDLNSTQEDKEILNSALPTKSSLLDIIELFESLNSITKVQNFAFESEVPRKDESGYNYLPVSLTLEGSLPQTLTALQRIQQTPYLFWVNQTIIESPNGLSQTIIIRASLRLYVREPFQEN